MVKRNTLICLILISILSPLTMWAQDDYIPPKVEKIRKSYKFFDNLYYGGNMCATYSMSSFVKEQSFLGMLRPSFEIFGGKRFTEWLGIGFSYGYHCQAASIGMDALQKIYDFSQDRALFNKGPNYSLHISKVGMDGFVNLSYLTGLSKKKNKWGLNLLFGGGMNTIFAYGTNARNWADYMDINLEKKHALEYYAGLQYAFHREHKNYHIQFTWHETSKDYNGLSTCAGARHYVELGVGFTTFLLNQYASYHFEKCQGNEKYYFQSNEKKMLKDYEKHNRSLFKKKTEVVVHPSENDTILSFPHTYPYLTPLQANKLKQMVERLKKKTSFVAVIDIYPNATRNDEMTLEQSVDRCKEEIRSVIIQYWGEEDIPVRFVTHNEEYSPLKPQGIWFHNAFITYEKK